MNHSNIKIILLFDLKESIVFPKFQKGSKFSVSVRSSVSARITASSYGSNWIRGGERERR